MMGWKSVAALVLVAIVAAAESAGAQSTPSPTISVSTDSIEMGELFELQVGIAVPPATIVYFPDTLAATVNLESAAPVRTRAEPTEDGGALLTLTYPVMAFGMGTLPIPGFDVLMAPRGDQAGVEVLPGGSVVGLWTDAPLRAGSVGLTRIPRQAVWVAPVFMPADFIEGIDPMPANDVAGGAWNWPSVALALLFSSVLAVTLVSTTRTWLTHSEGRGAPAEDPTLEALRQLALRQLDDLLADGIHVEGRLLDFYTRSSGIVRRYVEAMDRDWAPSLTSGELMGRLDERWGEEAAAGLPIELGAAEVVKFGRLRPDNTAAERNWRALRDWVDASGGRSW
jgi:hypothetical protein